MCRYPPWLLSELLKAWSGIVFRDINDFCLIFPGSHLAHCNCWYWNSWSFRVNHFGHSWIPLLSFGHFFCFYFLIHLMTNSMRIKAEITSTISQIGIVFLFDSFVAIFTKPISRFCCWAPFITSGVHLVGLRLYTFWSVSLLSPPPTQPCSCVVGATISILSKK